MPNGQMQAQGPQRMTWENIKEGLEADIENTEKRLELMKVQLELCKKMLK